MYKLQRNTECRQILEKLSKNRSYYGFLSAHILDTHLNIVNVPYAVDQKYLSKLNSKFEIKRIYELYILGKKRDARKELQYLFKNSNIEDLNALNILFKNWGWSDKIF